MALEQHIVALETKHDHLDKELRQELARPLPDTTTIRRIKHQKLEIKDEIQRLRQSVGREAA